MIYLLCAKNNNRHQRQKVSFLESLKLFNRQSVDTKNDVKEKRNNENVFLTNERIFHWKRHKLSSTWGS